MASLAKVRDALADHGIRDVADYAEVLIAEAVGGNRNSSGVRKGFDVLAPSYRRIEVKCRQLPTDGRLEERVAIGSTKENGFDHLAIVIFNPDCTVKGAVVVPYESVWAFVNTQCYNRISYRQACELPGAVDVTNAVMSVARH